MSGHFTKYLYNIQPLNGTFTDKNLGELITEMGHCHWLERYSNDAPKYPDYSGQKKAATFLKAFDI